MFINNIEENIFFVENHIILIFYMFIYFHLVFNFVSNLIKRKGTEKPL